MDTFTQIGKIAATGIIWVISGLIIIFAVTNVNTNYTDTVIVAPLIAALIGTGIIWLPDIIRVSQEGAERESAGKLKRRPSDESRYDLLMQMMDDDEREIFKETLKRRVLEDARYGGSRYGEDGELPMDADSLSDFIDHEPRRRRN